MEKTSKTFPLKEQLSDSDMLFKLGKVYYYNCDFSKAVHYLQLAKHEAKNEVPSPVEKIVLINNILMRISAEKLDLKKHEFYQKETADLLKKVQSEPLYAKYYYQLGLWSYYHYDFDKAKENFDKSYEFAKGSNNLADQAHALYGIASYYLESRNSLKMLKSLDKAKQLAKQIDNNDLLISIYIFKGLYLTDQKEFESGFKEFEKAKQVIRNHKNWYMNYIIMYHQALATQKTGDLLKARELYEHLYQQIHDTELNQIKKKAQSAIDELSNSQFDLIIDIPKRIVVESQKGNIPFKNCFLLMDILLLFARDASKTFSKEDLANLIWNEDYNPLIHDNKIYYNINRLRNLIESKENKTKYIITSKDGYFFNGDVKVQIREAL